MKDPLVEKLEAEIRYLRKLLDDNARRLPKSCWNSAASVKNSGLFRQSAAQGAWLYTGSLGDVVRQVQIWAIGSQGKALRILQRKVKVQQFGEE